MSTFPASPAPSQSSSAGIKPRVNSIQFGDGYSQRSPDGLNTTPQVYQLFWKSILESERASLDSFLQGCAGATSFDWTPPNQSTPLKFICKTWDWTYGEYNLCDFRATFEQVFET
jgi:phage-related protein